MEPVFPMPEPQPEPATVGGDVEQLLELLHESQERKAHLLRIQSELAEVKRKTMLYVADLVRERDQLRDQVGVTTHRANTAQTRLCLLHESLKRLVHAAQCVIEEEGWPSKGSTLADATEQARELVVACEPYLK